MPNTHTVFVYGTLRRGQSNHLLLESSPHLGDTRVRGRMFSLGAYPAITLRAEPSESVYVEAYRVTDKTLAELDRLEGHPTFYTRMLTFDVFREMRGYIYAMAGDSHYLDKAEEIKSGDWVRWKKGI